LLIGAQRIDVGQPLAEFQGELTGNPRYIGDVPDPLVCRDDERRSPIRRIAGVIRRRATSAWLCWSSWVDDRLAGAARDLQYAIARCSRSVGSRFRLVALTVAEAADKKLLTRDYPDISLSYPNSMENNMEHPPDERGHDSNFLEDDCSPFPFLFGGRAGGRRPDGPSGGGPGRGRGGGGRGGLPFGPHGFGPGGFGPGGPGGGHGFGPFGPGGFGFRRGPRARRGDIRAAILALLQEEPRNGYQIMQELKQRSQGMWNPSPGSVYPALQQLEDERLIANDEGSGGRIYALTSQGKAYVKEHADEIAAPWEALSNAAGDGFVEMMSLFHSLFYQLGAAAMQVVQDGNAAQIANARKILVATRRSLYEILAEGSSEDA
jgi:DNA-binding PadR family transcriptional regulator